MFKVFVKVKRQFRQVRKKVLKKSSWRRSAIKKVVSHYLSFSVSRFELGTKVELGTWVRTRDGKTYSKARTRDNAPTRDIIRSLVRTLSLVGTVSLVRTLSLVGTIPGWEIGWTFVLNFVVSCHWHHASEMTKFQKKKITCETF